MRLENDDLVGIMLHAAVHPEIQGAVNGVAPEPVTNRAFTQRLGAVLHRPTVLSVPASILRLAVGEFATVLLASQRVVPERISVAGYTFSFSGLDEALADVL